MGTLAQELVCRVGQVQQRLGQGAERECDGGGDRDDGRGQEAGHHDVANLLTKPLVSGIPANASRNSEKTTLTTG